MEDPTLTSEQYIDSVHALRRWWAWIGLIAVLAAVGAGLYGTSRSNTFTSSINIVLQPLPGNPLSSDALVSNQRVALAMAAEVALVDSLPVVEAARASLPKGVVAGGTAIKATLVNNTKTITIDLSAASATAARRGVTAIAHAFLVHRADIAKTLAKSETSALESQLRQAQRALALALAQASKRTATATEKSQVDLFTRQVTMLQQQAASRQEVGSAPGVVATTATRPYSSDGVSTRQLVAAGGLTGLVLAALAALLYGRREAPIHAATLGAVQGLPVLARLPTGSRSASRRRRQLGPARIGQRDAYLAVRTAVLTAVPRGSTLVVADVVSDQPEVGAAANLAISLGAAGFRVVFVNFRAASSGFGADSRPDLVDLVDSEWLDGWTRPLARRQGVDVVSARGFDLTGRDRSAGPSFQLALLRFKSLADYVVITGPPLDTARGEWLAGTSDWVLLAAIDGETSRRSIGDTVDRLERRGTAVLGLVVAAARSRSARRAERSATAAHGRRS